MSTDWSRSLTPLWALRRLMFLFGLGAVVVVVAACRSNAAAPSASTPASSPSMSQTESASPATPTTERVHFAGLPSKGAHASTPATGKLVLSLNSTWSTWSVYADGRMIWQKWNHSMDPVVIPQGARMVDTGYVQQRLTPQGVQLLRSRILSTGLFEHNLWLGGRHHPRVLVRVWNGDRLVSVESVHVPYPPSRHHFTKETPAQARALARVEVLLAHPAVWLPTTAWADREIRAFVPSRYWFNFDRSAPDMSKLPSPARALLQKPLQTLFAHTCHVVVVTTDRARAILKALMEPGIPPSTNQASWIGFGAPSYLHFSPALPDDKTCPAPSG